MKKKTNLPLLILASGVTAVWQFWDITTATEAPRQALAILQYINPGDGGGELRRLDRDVSVRQAVSGI